MESNPILPQWSPRIAKHKVRRLYEFDAQGIPDDELADEVGYTLLARCKSFITANQAVAGQAPCPVCETIVEHAFDKDEVLHCDQCGWELPWGDYFATIQKKQLSGAEPVIELFTEFIESFPRAKTYPEKMFQIDRLLHGFHWNQKYGFTRPVAVNLIQGRLTDVVKFLDDLSRGPGSTPGIQQHRGEWQAKSTNTRKWTRTSPPDDSASG